MEIYQDYLQKRNECNKEADYRINLEDYDFYDLRDPKNFMHISKNDYCQIK